MYFGILADKLLSFGNKEALLGKGEEMLLEIPVSPSPSPSSVLFPPSGSSSPLLSRLPPSPLCCALPPLAGPKYKDRFVFLVFCRK